MSDNPGPTMYDWFAATAARYPDAEAPRVRGGSLTSRELRRVSDSLAGDLSRVTDRAVPGEPGLRVALARRGGGGSRALGLLVHLPQASIAGSSCGRASSHCA